MERFCQKVKCSMSKNDLIDQYTIFRWLWLIVLLPKPVQTCVYLIVFCVLICKYPKLKPDTITILVSAYAMLHFVSICVNITEQEYELNRIIAALNTCFLWFIAILFYNIYRSKYGYKTEMEKFAKYMIWNGLIVTLTCVVSKTLGIKFVHLGRKIIAFWIADYIGTYPTTRFSGGFLYPTLIAILGLILFPIVFRYFYGRAHNLKAVAVTVLLLLYPVFCCRSRIGLLLFAADIGIAVYICMQYNCWFKHNKCQFFYLVCLCLGFIVIVFSPYIYTKLHFLYNSRSESNTMRMLIYNTSITTCITNHPWIGMGIKSMIDDYPLGSHSTYIGTFYKTGILGCLILGTAFVCTLYKLWKRYYRKEYIKIWFVYILTFLFMLIFEDLDGENWLIITTFSIVGILLSRPIANEYRRSNS